VREGSSTTYVIGSERVRCPDQEDGRKRRDEADDRDEQSLRALAGALNLVQMMRFVFDRMNRRHLCREPLLRFGGAAATCSSVIRCSNRGIVQSTAREFIRRPVTHVRGISRASSDVMK
jgi:hypothetical protein